MTTWHPDYTKAYEKKVRYHNALALDQKLLESAKKSYRVDPVAFIEDWCITYDPRNAGTGTPAKMPFLLFERQKEFIRCLDFCVRNNRHILVEKCRDAGLTWLCSAYSVHQWLFNNGASIGWGSRKAALVHRLGDMDSIFEKMRMIVQNLPKFLLPKGYDEKFHFTTMKVINPENKNSITGEAGDAIGRGGRKKMYFKDESAHYERPEQIEAALGDNTDVQIDISSVNGTGNIFYRRRMAGVVWDSRGTIDPTVDRHKAVVFIFDWRDHPGKTQEWYDERRRKAEAEGITHLFAQEVDRDYTASVEGILIPAKWVKAAVDAHKILGFDDEGMTIAGLDVADEGGDKNALCIRKGSVMKSVTDWAQGDTGVTANKAVTECALAKVSELQYDCIGVGAGVKAETNRLKKEGAVPKGMDIVPWNAAAAVLFPEENVILGDEETPINKDYYANLKAQGWWQLRLRFEKTFKFVTQGIEYPSEELISIPSDMEGRHELETELSQPQVDYDKKRRIMIMKAPKGTKSPNLADSVNIAFWPIQKKRVYI